MRKLAPITTAALVALGLALSAAGPASAAVKKVPYKGKTSSGHPITFTVKGKKIIDYVAGLRVTCLAIQGGGAPLTGADYSRPKGWLKIGDKVDFWYMAQPAFGWREVRKNQRFTSKRHRNGTITGTVRMQYQFLIPKYTPGTFSIYSCLGKVAYKAKPVKKKKRR
jgi:hypothetical protein